MTHDTQDDAAMQKAMERIQKLLNLANNNPNEAEAASALARAQEMLEAYNLDIATVEAKSGEKGARIDASVSGGMYKYQRALMRSIAQLNFCWYWTMKVPVKPGSIQAKRGRSVTHEQRLLGRKVNVVSTQNMADYLNGTIERLCRERMVDDGLSVKSQFYSAWAIAFREGIADRVIEKIKMRRWDAEEAEKKKAAEAAERAATAGFSTSTALTLSDVRQAEEEANYDFLNGAGAYARREAERALSHREWEARRARQAAADAAAEQAHAEWAAAHPEEAAAEARKLAAEQRKADRAASRRSYSYRERAPTGEDLRRQSGGYAAGYRAGKDVSIDPQAAHRKAGLIT